MINTYFIIIIFKHDNFISVFEQSKKEKYMPFLEEFTAVEFYKKKLLFIKNHVFKRWVVHKV